MAENLDNQSFGNFSIQDTMEMGMGNQELLNDLMGPETSTTNPDDIQDINTPDKTTEPAPAKQAPSKKDAPAAETDSEKKEEATKSLQDFLLGDDKEDEEEEATPLLQKLKLLKLNQLPRKTRMMRKKEILLLNQLLVLYLKIYSN